MSRLARFSWTVLAYNIAVILWGAYVRASGSGAGCGAHWPLCNGEIIPRGARLATLIEFSHRLTSGIALVAVVALLVWTWRVAQRGHPARPAAALSLFFMLTEAAVGAGLVLFQLVADNASFARAMFLSAHLINTFTLLACLTATAWFASGGARLRLAGQRGRAVAIGLLCLGVLAASTSGAVAALGDTLFPVTSLTQALWDDLSMTSHVLIRLRVLHPVVAALTALSIVAFTRRIAEGRGASARRAAQNVATLAVLQIALGVLNVFLLAPVWLQLLHLLVADAVWISLVLLGLTTLAAPASARTAAHAA
ncbi:MAG: COX15/CtaA family protein [Acidobacteriota bacterium]